MQGTVDEEGNVLSTSCLISSDKNLMGVDYTISMANYKMIDTSAMHSTSLSSIPEHSSLKSAHNELYLRVVCS